jgi:hypothetical protein
MIYKYTSQETAKQVLDNCKIGFTRVSYLNDPFEFDFRSLLEISAESSSTDMQELMDLTATYQAKRDWIDNDAGNKFLVFSGSLVDNNNLMWAHYAERNCGIVLGFGEALSTFGDRYYGKYADDNFEVDENNKLKKYVKYFRVQYSKVKHIQRFGDPDIEPLRWKSIDWNYEEEFRSVMFEKDIAKKDYENGILVTFPTDGLYEVVFGYRFDKSRIKEWKSKYSEKYEHLRFYQMQLKNDVYELCKIEV